MPPSFYFVKTKFRWVTFKQQLGLRTDKNVVCAVVHNDHDIQQHMYDSLGLSIV